MVGVRLLRAWEHARGAEGVFEDLAALGGAYKALVGSLVPADPRFVPVALQAVGLDGGTTRSTVPAKMALRSWGITGSSASGETGRSSALSVSSRIPSALMEWIAMASALVQNRCEGSTAGLPATAQSRSFSSEASRETA